MGNVVKLTDRTETWGRACYVSPDDDIHVFVSSHGRSAILVKDDSGQMRKMRVMSMTETTKLLASISHELDSIGKIEQSM